MASGSYSPMNTSYDVGVYLTKRADDNVKLFIAEHPWMPPKNFQWPSSTHVRRNSEGDERMEIRKLSSCHLKQFSWVAYSESTNGILCRFCVLFGKRGGVVGASSCGQLAGKFVTKPCDRYDNLTGDKWGYLNKHSKAEYHMQAVQAAADFSLAQTRPETAIGSRVDSQRLKDLKLLRERLGPIVKTIVLCGRQNIPLRGNVDAGRVNAAEPDRNEGNFRAILRFRAEVDEQLRRHLSDSSGNAMYTSSVIQNELIDLIGTLVQENIVDSINSSKAGPCFSVLVDETTDISTTEQLSLCVRFVSDDGTVHESFLGFCDLHDEAFFLSFDSVEHDEVLEPKVTGATIARVVEQQVRDLGLNMGQCVGQGYDGAAVMSSKSVGVAAIISKKYPMAANVHCLSHSLNLALVSASKLRQVANMYGTVKETVTFVNGSAKRSALFKAAVRHKCPEAKRRRLLKFCETRWVERHDALTTFLELYDAVALTLDHISKWRDTNASSKASVLSLAIKNGDFILVLHATAKVMAHTRPLSVRLQAEDLDLSGALPQIENVSMALQQLREEAEEEFRELFDAANQKVAEVGASPISTPRGKQADTTDAERHHRITTFIPLLDETISQLGRRFEKQTKTAMELGKLLPGHPAFESVGDDVVMSLAEQYQAQLDVVSSSSMGVTAEFKVYKTSWLRRPPEERPRTYKEALERCDQTSFPCVWRLLRVGACQPVTTASTERSFSVLRRVKTWQRNRTGETRLTGLALMNIHPGAIPGTDAILDRFMRQKNRRGVW